jgi:hypothetical protein
MKRPLTGTDRLAPSVDESEITGYIPVSVIWVVALVSVRISFKLHTNRGRADHSGWQATVLGNQPSFLIVPCLSWIRKNWP